MKPGLIVLSGGGSPHSKAYSPVYRVIAEAAARRGVPHRLVDYVGCGHDDGRGSTPNWGDGLSLPTAIARAREALKDAAPGSTLFYRSFGCDVCLGLAAREPDLIRQLGAIILWGPSPYHYYWNLVGAAEDAIPMLNDKVSAKGLKLSQGFWRSFVPIEESAKSFPGHHLTIGYGTDDCDCDAAFATYLSSIVMQYAAGTDVSVISIAGAPHAITRNNDPQMLAQYMKLIFGT